MIELIYPVEDYAPVFPARNSRDVEIGTDKKTVSEMFPIIEESGLVTGMAERGYCHGGSKLLHPVVHLHILDRSGRIYLQKRSMKKDIQPGRWDTAVGGHVSYGENILEALMRESQEELSFSKYNPIHICSYVFESEIEREHVNVFAAVGSKFVLQPDGDEIDEGRFWDLADIDSNLGSGLFTPNFEQEYRMIKEKLISLL